MASITPGRLSSAARQPGGAQRRKTVVELVAAYAAAWAAGLAFAGLLMLSGTWRTGASWEYSLLRALHTALPEMLDRLLLFSPWIGTNYSVLPAAVLAGLVLWRRYDRLGTAVHLLVVSIGSASLNPSMKFLLGRPRPAIFPQRGMFQWSSYPSGHAILTTAFYFTIALLLWERRRSRWMFVVAPLIVLTTCYARLYLSVHWPTDVLGGLVIGVTWLAGTWIAFGRHRRRMQEAAPSRANARASLAAASD